MRRSDNLQCASTLDVVECGRSLPAIEAMRPRGCEVAIDSSSQPHTLSFSDLPFIYFHLIHSMEPSAVDFTEESRVCYRCEKIWADDDAVDRDLWKIVSAQITRQRHSICGACAIYYSEKSRSEHCDCCWQFHSHSDAFTETSRAEPPPPRTTGQALPVQKLVANSQRGIGAYSAKH